jgi:hypothetical protein
VAQTLKLSRWGAAASTLVELEAVVRWALGSSDLMEFVRFDSGDVLRNETGGNGPKMLRLVVGNPLIMKEMAKVVPDAASYVPLTILVDERADGVHLSYDFMTSLLAPYGQEAALELARDVDAKIEDLLKAAAQRLARHKRAIWRVLHQKVRYVEHGLRSCNPQALQKRKKPLLYEFRRLG